MVLCPSFARLYSLLLVVVISCSTTTCISAFFVVPQPQRQQSHFGIVQLRRASTSSVVVRQSSLVDATTNSTDNDQQQQEQQPQQIISPFDTTSSSSSTATTSTSSDSKGILDLTYDNVEMVLDEMRPYLIQDGGNVVIADIDGPVVKLELQGACGTCPSSTQTLKMGLERGLKERIPEIQEVIQAMPQGPPLQDDQIEIVLDGVRPFLEVVGGTIDIDRIEGVDSIQPTIWLHMQGSSASLNSVKLEIAQRLQRHFMMSGLQIQWKE